MEKTDRKPIVILIILLLAGILRLLFASARGIWYDDAFSILLSEQGLGNIIRGTAADTMPPFYYFLLHFWMLLSPGILFIRLLNILLSLVVVCLVYRMGVEIAGQSAGWIAAGLTAVAPLQIYHAQEVRMYVLLELFLVVYAWMCLRLFSQPQKQTWSWGMLVLAGAGAFYSHNLAIFTLAVPDLILLVQRKWRLLLQLVAAQFIMLVLFLPWLFFVPGQIEKIQTAFWTPRPGLVEIVQSVGNLYGYLPQPVIVTALILILAVQALGLLGLQLWRNRSAEMALPLLGWIVLPPLLLFAASYLMRPVYVPRAFIASGIFVYLLAGFLSARILAAVPRRNIFQALVVPILFALSAVVSLPGMYSFDTFPRSPFRQAAETLVGQCDPADCMVVHDNKLSYFPMAIYQPHLSQAYLPDEPGTHNDTLAKASQVAIGRLASETALAAADNRREVYLVIFERAIGEYQALGLETAPSLGVLKTAYTLLGQSTMGDLVIYHFGK